MKKRLTPTRVSNYISIISIVIAVSSTLISYKFGLLINLKSEKANTTAEESKLLAQEALDFDKENKSYQIVSTAFNDIYDNQQTRRIINNIKDNITVDNKDNLLRLVDIIEGVGNNYCQGLAWKWHINTILQNTLIYVCNNKEISNEFANKKNGTSMLCYEFFPDSPMAQNINRENISTCKFHDSSVFNK